MAYKILNDDLTFANVNSENPKVCFLHGWGTSGKDFNKIEKGEIQPDSEEHPRYMYTLFDDPCPLELHVQLIIRVCGPPNIKQHR